MFLYFSMAARILSWFAWTADALLLLVSRWVTLQPSQQTVWITSTTTPMRNAGLCSRLFVLCLLFPIVRHSKHFHCETCEIITHGVICVRCSRRRETRATYTLTPHALCQRERERLRAKALFRESRSTVVVMLNVQHCRGYVNFDEQHVIIG